MIDVEWWAILFESWDDESGAYPRKYQPASSADDAERKAREMAIKHRGAGWAIAHVVKRQTLKWTHTFTEAEVSRDEA